MNVVKYLFEHLHINFNEPILVINYQILKDDLLQILIYINPEISDMIFMNFIIKTICVSQQAWSSLKETNIHCTYLSMSTLVPIYLLTY